MNRRLPTRQVHLDFHTSGHIGDIGRDFSKEQFQNALKMGHVNSITVFGKCHHGYCYYPTKVGTIHPGLAPGRDLAGEMMDACHEIGVYAPLYLTLGWSALDAVEHPEWICRAKDGSYTGVNYDFGAKEADARPECSWIHLCSAGEYRQYLYDLTREVCERYERLDGLFFDIVFVTDACYCDHCVKGMRKMGLDPNCIEDAKKYYQMQKKETLDGLRAILKQYHPEASVFFNSGGAEIHMPQWHYASTHFEMEDLPTTWGGYDKMPMRARYFAGKGKDYLGMTGKFHLDWGEFGGFKTPEALKFECASMMANGACCSVGDQLHPHGRMDEETYKNIGYAYSYVEQIEEYCRDTQETARLGVMVSLDSGANEAMAKLLLDCHVDFDVVHSPESLGRFDTVIIPDNYRLNAEMGAAFEEYIADGGKVLMLGGSGLKEEEDVFAFSVPFVYRGKSKYDKDFFEVVGESISTDDSAGEDAAGKNIAVEGAAGKNADAPNSAEIVKSPILCYTSAHYVEGEGEVLARIKEPFFSRTYGTYCSHRNTPYQDEYSEYPAAVKCGNILYAAHELAGMYHDYGAVYHRRYFLWLLRQLYQADVVQAEMPVQGRLHLVKREQEKQYVLHLTYGSPIQRGSVSVMEDFPTLYRIPVKLALAEEVESMTLIPQNETVEFTKSEDGYEVMIPEMTAHQMLVVGYH